MTDAKLALVLCYFGPLPNYADLFFNSVRANPEIDFILVTDQLVKEPPANLKIKQLTLPALRAKFQRKISFPIRLHQPYKICDYRPAFGWLLADWLKDYRYWGYCDLDQVMGRLAKFVPASLLAKYDKLYQNGHLTIFRNTVTNNLRFMARGGMDYRRVFQTDVACVFDEVAGIQRKFDLLGIRSYQKRNFADIYSWRDQMRRTKSYLKRKDRRSLNHSRQTFFYERGRIYRAYYEDGRIKYEELAYLHFPKRAMSRHFYQSDSYFIGKDGFYAKEPGFNVTMGEIKRYNGFSLPGELRVMLAHWHFKWRRRWRKYLLGRN